MGTCYSSNRGENNSNQRTTVAKNRPLKKKLPRWTYDPRKCRPVSICDSAAFHGADSCSSSITGPLSSFTVGGISSVTLSAARLEKMRAEFWDTAPAFEGRCEIWDALHAACTAIESEHDFTLAQAILDGANITLPRGTLSECYDELGNRYRIPSYCITTPTNFAPNLSSPPLPPKPLIGFVTSQATSVIDSHHNISSSSGLQIAQGNGRPSSLTNTNTTTTDEEDNIPHLTICDPRSRINQNPYHHPQEMESISHTIKNNSSSLVKLSKFKSSSNGNDNNNNHQGGVRFLSKSFKNPSNISIIDTTTSDLNRPPVITIAEYATCANGTVSTSSLSDLTSNILKKHILDPIRNAVFGHHKRRNRRVYSHTSSGRSTEPIINTSASVATISERNNGQFHQGHATQNLQNNNNPFSSPFTSDDATVNCPKINRDILPVSLKTSKATSKSYFITSSTTKSKSKKESSNVGTEQTTTTSPVIAASTSEERHRPRKSPNRSGLSPKRDQGPATSNSHHASPFRDGVGLVVLKLRIGSTGRDLEITCAPHDTVYEAKKKIAKIILNLLIGSRESDSSTATTNPVKTPSLFTTTPTTPSNELIDVVLGGFSDTVRRYLDLPPLLLPSPPLLPSLTPLPLLTNPATTSLVGRTVTVDKGTVTADNLPHVSNVTKSNEILLSPSRLTFSAVDPKSENAFFSPTNSPLSLSTPLPAKENNNLEDPLPKDSSPVESLSYLEIGTEAATLSADTQQQRNLTQNLGEPVYLSKNTEGSLENEHHCTISQNSKSNLLLLSAPDGIKDHFHKTLPPPAVVDAYVITSKTKNALITKLIGAQKWLLAGKIMNNKCTLQQAKIPKGFVIQVALCI